MIISSQRYLDYNIVDAKIEELAGQTEITLGTWSVEIDGEKMEVLFDGHHALAAAKELGIIVKFESTEHPEKLSGTDLLDASWLDSNWYDIETEIDVW